MSIEVTEQLVRNDKTPRDRAIAAVAEFPAPRRVRVGHTRLGRAVAESKLGPRYWSLWGATSVSSLGDGLALVGFPLLAASYTRDGLALSGLLVAQRLPWLFFSLPLGALADRVDRRRMAISIEVTRMAVLGAFAALLAAGHGGLGLLYLTAFVLGALETGFVAAMAATVPEVVAAEHLVTANGHLAAATSAGEQFIGPALGGLLFAAVAALPFVLDGVSFAASAGLLLLVFPRRRRLPSPAVSDPATTGAVPGAPSGVAPGVASGVAPAPAPASAPAPRASLWADVRVGVEYLARHRLLRLLGGVVAGLAFCQAMVMGVLVAYGLGTLHLSRAGYGLFLGLGALGNVIGGAVAGRAHARVGTAALLVAGGTGAGAAYLLLGAWATVPVAVGALFIECVCVSWGNVASISVRQTVIPPELLGRTGNAFRMVIWGVIPIGALAGGLAVRLSSLSTAFIVAGLLQLGLVAVSARPLASLIRDTVIDVRDVREDVVSLDDSVDDTDIITVTP